MEDNRLRLMDKKDFSEYTEPEVVATVIMKTNFIEKKLEEVIVDFFSIQDDEKQEIFKTQFLNNAFFSLGNKVKFCYASGILVNNSNGVKKDDFLKLLSYRNAFAHQNLFISTELGFESISKVEGKEVVKLTAPVKSQHLIPFVESDGRLQHKDAKELFLKFIELFDKIKTLFH